MFALSMYSVFFAEYLIFGFFCNLNNDRNLLTTEITISFNMVLTAIQLKPSYVGMVRTRARQKFDDNAGILSRNFNDTVI